MRDGDRLALAHWNGKRVVIGPEIVKSRKKFTVSAAWESEELVTAMQLPTEARSYGSGRELIKSLQAFFAQHSGLNEESVVLLVSFVLSTWFTDTADYRPCFSIVSPQHQSCALLLRMLQCVCRHALHLVEMRESEILSLPFYLAPTILLHQGRPSAGLQRILRAMSRPSISVFRNLECKNASASLVICSDEDIGGPLDSVEITLMPARVANITAAMLDRAAVDFQCQLLQYRLENFSTVKNSIVDVSELDSPQGRDGANIGSGDLRSQQLPFANA